MKVAEYIAQRLADWGTRHVFLVTGGGAMHLNDAFGHESRLGCVCCHHEQAVAMAAECHARITGLPGVINVTTGPGGINALNGVFGAWTDSIPMLVISGQVKRETCMATAGACGLRQLGDQEADILEHGAGHHEIRRPDRSAAKDTLSARTRMASGAVRAAGAVLDRRAHRRAVGAD